MGPTLESTHTTLNCELRQSDGFANSGSRQEEPEQRVEKRLASKTAEQNLKLFDIKNRAAIKKKNAFKILIMKKTEPGGRAKSQQLRALAILAEDRRTGGPRRRFQLPHGASRPSLTPVPWLLTFFGLVHT